jgi:hypothetical protein
LKNRRNISEIEEIWKKSKKYFKKRKNISKIEEIC